MVGQLYYPKSDCRRMEGKFPYEPRDISEEDPTHRLVHEKSLAAMLKVWENTPLYSVINWPQALFVPYASVQSVSPCERLVSILGCFCSYYAEVFFMSTRKAVRYSVCNCM